MSSRVDVPLGETLYLHLLKFTYLNIGNTLAGVFATGETMHK